MQTRRSVDMREPTSAAFAVLVSFASFFLLWLLTGATQLVLYLLVSTALDVPSSSFLPEVLLLSAATGIAVHLLRIRGAIVVAFVACLAIGHVCLTVTFQRFAYSMVAPQPARSGAYGDWVLLVLLTWTIVIIRLSSNTRARFGISLSSLILTVVAAAMILSIVMHYWRYIASFQP